MLTFADNRRARALGGPARPSASTPAAPRRAGDATPSSAAAAGHDFGRIAVRDAAEAARGREAGPRCEAVRELEAGPGRGAARSPSRGSSPSALGRGAGALITRPKLFVRGLTPQPDRIHGPLLDHFSRDAELPRERVSQHDPRYEGWLAGDPLAPELRVTLDMNVPAVPAPDFSRDEHALGAWERANFIFAPQFFFNCGRAVEGGAEASFVTDVGLRITRPRFEFFIATHIRDNRSDPSRPAPERLTWWRIYERIRLHALEHFARYGRVVAATRADLERRFAALPRRGRPARMPQQELETYLRDLLAHLDGRLRYDLWDTTCQWERTDYPRLLSGIPNVQGSFRPACDPRPTAPPEPLLVTATPPAPPPAPRRRGRGARP
ncbi:MAG TPA: hypothetical protein VF668_18105 [Pyrinomonadaceae bacterium]|jgi:hypothetical protein